MNKYDEYQVAKREKELAKTWDNMRNERERSGSYFSLSAPHCSIKLTRCGQYDTGGKNYWESSEALNKALIQVIVNDHSIIERALEILSVKEKEALTACRGFAEEIIKNVEHAEQELKELDKPTDRD